MKKIIHTITFLALCFSVMAQKQSRKEKQGDKFYFVYSFDKAIHSYKGADELTLQGQRNLAKSYSNIDALAESEDVYSKLVLNPAATPEDYYNFAMVLKRIGKYDVSDFWMGKFVALKPNDLRAISYQNDRADLSNLSEDKGRFKIKKLDNNTGAQDFGTAYDQNNVVFASTRSSGSKRKANSNGKPYLNLYAAALEKNQFKSPEKFSKKLNGKLHDGPASFSNNGTFMAYSRNDAHDKTADNIIEQQIAFSTKTEDKWSKPQPFSLNNPAYSVEDPCLSADGKTMYFSSNMPGGKGGFDIYRTTKDASGNWAKAENMGDKINTEGDEVFPFFEENNQVLFFASDGRFGLGGLDIFISNLEGTGFANTRNAGAPLNTQYDDYAVVVNKELTEGFFSSNRIGGSGDDDLYGFNILTVLTGNEIVENTEDEKEPEPYVVPVEAIKEGADLGKIVSFDADQIYFDYDRYEIRRDAEPELTRIVRVMNEYPNMIVELHSHADCRGSAEYNQDLSEKRAKATVDYIRARITNPERISGKGMGESQLINDCPCDDKVSRCTEAQHQQNRRSEFIILKK